MNNECMRIKGIVVSDDFKRGYRVIMRLRCKQWSCPYCGPVNAQSWRAYLLDRFNKEFGHDKWLFCTITAHRNAHVTPEATILNLQRGWKKLYDRLLRRYGRDQCQYIRVFERHKSGRFHMHFLINAGEAYDAHGFIAESLAREFRHPECVWLRRACVGVGMGWRVHMRRVWDDVKRTANVGLVVGYILKYMGKDMSSFPFPKHQRRVQASRKIGSPQRSKAGQGTWLHKREMSEVEFRLSPSPVLDYSTGEVLTIESFEGEGYYPPMRFYRGDGWDSGEEGEEGGD